MLTLGKSGTKATIIDLRTPIRDAEALVRPGLRPPLSLAVDLPDTPVRAQADKTAVVQMIMNLVINARDALIQSPPDGRSGKIEVAVTVPGEITDTPELNVGAIDPNLRYACITVSDNGPGMTDEVLSQIFMPYFSTKGERGTGLGVPIVVNAVQDHGGALHLQSTLGVGTTFTIYWPLSAETVGNESEVMA
jgi:signal transduction histidine kinase